MFGDTKVVADVTVTTPTTFALGAVAGARHGFSVEEQEMITEVTFRGTMAPTTADTPIDVTFFIDGVDAADLVDGLQSFTAGKTTGLGDIGVTLTLKKRLAKGAHTAEFRVRAAAGNVVVKGLLRPCHLTVTRWSVNAVNAPASNSKQVSGVY